MEQRRNSGDFVWSVFDAAGGLIGGVSSLRLRHFLCSRLSHSLSLNVSLHILSFPLSESVLLLFPLNVEGRRFNNYQRNVVSILRPQFG